MSFDNQTYDRYHPADDLTVNVVEAVQGRHFVAFTGAEVRGHASVVPATAGTFPAGVAAYDAAAGDLVGLKRGNRVITVAVDADIPAGTAVEVGAGGVAVALDTGIPVGTVYGRGTVDRTVLVALNV